MATIQTTRTFEDIILAVLERGKIALSIDAAEEGTLNAIKRFINDRYDQVAFSKVWPWREDTRDIVTTPKVTAGTASVTNGLREVILSTGTVDQSFKGRTFQITGSQDIYEIIAVHDAPNRKFQLSAPFVGTTDAAANYTIYRNDYGLFPNYSEIVEVTPSGVAGIYNPRPLELVNSEEMSELRAMFPGKEQQFPTHCTIQDRIIYSGPFMGPNFIMGYDFMGEGPTNSISFYPNILQANLIHVKFGKQLIKLDNLDDEPIIPTDRRKVLVYGALADWYSLQGKEDLFSFYDKKFEQFLNRMMADFDKTETRACLSPIRPVGRYTRKGRKIYPYSP